VEIGIDGALAARGVAVRLGWLAGTVERPADHAALAAALAAEVARIAADPTPPAAVPAIAATRHAYKTLGKDPSRYRPAAEALRRRVQQGKGLGAVCPLVDVNNLLSLATGLSSGVYDLERLVPPLALRVAAAGASYEGIGRGPLNLEGLPVLCDAAGPFGSPTSDSLRAAVGAATRHVLMVIYGFCAAGVDGPSLDRAAALLAAHAGVTVSARGIAA
jgi:DNA/RNA-binding domain of Phe-tRNA-synthetase-like protein